MLSYDWARPSLSASQSNELIQTMSSFYYRYPNIYSALIPNPLFTIISLYKHLIYNLTEGKELKQHILELLNRNAISSVKT